MFKFALTLHAIAGLFGLIAGPIAMYDRGLYIGRASFDLKVGAELVALICRDF